MSMWPEDRWEQAELEHATCPRCGGYLRGADRRGMSALRRQMEGCSGCLGAQPAKTPEWEPLIKPRRRTAEERADAVAVWDMLDSEELEPEEKTERRETDIAAWLAGA